MTQAMLFGTWQGLTFVLGGFVAIIPGFFGSLPRLSNGGDPSKPLQFYAAEPNIFVTLMKLWVGADALVLLGVVAGVIR